MLVATNTRMDSGSLNKIAVLNVATNRWTYETQWHNAGAWNAPRVAEFTFTGRGYYKVYVYYAQSTTKGWMYDGEYLSQYNQHAGNQSSRSLTCLMG